MHNNQFNKINRFFMKQINVLQIWLNCFFMKHKEFSVTDLLIAQIQNGYFPLSMIRCSNH